MRQDQASHARAQPSNPAIRIATLDSIRGIAALVVVLHHFQIVFGLQPYFDCGYLAVDVFFLLSGLVLAMRYEEAIATRRVSVGRFIVARIGRLYPLQAATTIFMVIPQNGIPFGDAIANLLMLQGTGAISPNYAMPSWSISTEFAVNIAYALMLRFGLARNVVLAAIVVGLTYVLIGAFGYGLNLSFNKFDWGPIAAGMPRCFIGFFLGVGFYRFVVAPQRYLVSASLANLSFMLAVAGIGYLVATKQPLLSMTTDDYLALYVFFPCLIYAALCPRGIAHRILSTAPLVWLGKISYSIYLLQVPIMYLYDSMVRPHVAAVSKAPLVNGIAYFILLLVASELSFRFIEQKGKALVGYWAGSSARRIAATATAPVR